MPSLAASKITAGSYRVGLRSPPSAWRSQRPPRSRRRSARRRAPARRRPRPRRRRLSPAARSEAQREISSAIAATASTPPALGDPDEAVRVEVVAEQHALALLRRARRAAAGRSGRGRPRRSSRARARTPPARAARRSRPAPARPAGRSAAAQSGLSASASARHLVEHVHRSGVLHIPRRMHGSTGTVTFFLYFDDREHAEHAHAALTVDGFACRHVDPPEDAERPEPGR